MSTPTCVGQPLIKGSTSESSAEIVSDVKFWRIKSVSSNHRFPPCTERSVNFSYTLHSLRITASASLQKRNAIPVTPHLNDWYIKHAESCWRTPGKINNPKQNKKNNKTCTYSVMQSVVCEITKKSSISRNGKTALCAQLQKEEKKASTRNISLQHLLANQKPWCIRIFCGVNSNAGYHTRGGEESYFCSLVQHARNLKASCCPGSRDYGRHLSWQTGMVGREVFPLFLNFSPVLK